MRSFKKIFGYFNYHNYSGTDIKVLRDWKLTILFFVVLLMSIALFNFYIFWNMNKVIDSEVDIFTEEKGETINRAFLNNILDEINSREAKFEKNLSAPEIKDPSL